jgi:uncharacterized protein (TIGR00730 family)
VWWASSRKALVEKEWANHDCTELHVVDTMHERKRMMAERADAFLALPGGIGTFEELFEVWTWRQLGYHDKPVGLLNTGGLLRRLLAFLQSSVAPGFMGDWQMDLIRTGTSAPPCCSELVQAAGLGPAPAPWRVNLRLFLRRRFRPSRRCGCAPRAPRW